MAGRKHEHQLLVGDFDVFQIRQAGFRGSVPVSYTHLYTDYEAFLREGDMDTVYVGLINTQHYSYAKQALLAGKHVICEKPLTETAAQARELADLAREKNLFLWEAFKLPYGSILPAVKEHVKELGPVRVVQCSYCRTGKAYEEYLAGSVRPVLDPACAGGSLYDVNVYNLHFVMSLFGVPEKVCYTANRGRNGVDTSGTAVLQYDGFLAVCTAAMDCSSDNFCMIQGEKGWLRTEGPISSASRAVPVSYTHLGTAETETAPGTTLTTAAFRRI